MEKIIPIFAYFELQRLNRAFNAARNRTRVKS